VKVDPSDRAVRFFGISTMSNPVFVFTVEVDCSQFLFFIDVLLAIDSDVQEKGRRADGGPTGHGATW